MHPITALLHTYDDALRLGRALETLYPCDDILVVDHGSRDATVQIAREYGARVVATKSTGQNAEQLFKTAGWILCLDPRESLTEGLAASLFEWKTEGIPQNALAFSIFIREETADGWIENPSAQTRLVRADWSGWNGRFPRNHPHAVALEGELLRFALP